MLGIGSKTLFSGMEAGLVRIDSFDLNEIENHFLRAPLNMEQLALLLPRQVTQAAVIRADKCYIVRKD